jgi:hypothetical protein
MMPAPPADLLSQAVQIVRRELDPSLPISERLRTIWAGALAASDLGAVDVVEAEFLALAEECGVLRDLGRTAHTDLVHIIRWAFVGHDPFGN